MPPASVPHTSSSVARSSRPPTPPPPRKPSSPSLLAPDPNSGSQLSAPLSTTPHVPYRRHSSRRRQQPPHGRRRGGQDSRPARRQASLRALGRNLCPQRRRGFLCGDLPRPAPDGGAL